MYRNKKDVDKYVENLISKLSVREFRARAYSVARLYFEVGDYGSCQKYVEQYLTQKDNNAAAHRLLGQALQKLGQKEKALEQYKISLDVDATQTNLVLEICELLSEDDVMIDPGRAKYWCEKAETIFPKHPVSFRLREKLLSLSNRDPETLGKLLSAEMEARPKDVLLHIRLMKHYMELNQIKEVINHSLNVEFGENYFFNNYHWYETLSEILKHYSDNVNDWTYQLLLLTVRERICALSLTETPNGTSKSLVESNELLHMYDQALDNVVKAGASTGFGDFHFNLVNHHKGQFALHAATFLLKKAKKDQISWREATKTAAPLMLIAWHMSPIDPSANVLSSQQRIPNKQQEALLRWHLEGAYRCSQSGHYLLSNIRDKTQSFLDEISQCFSGTHWRDKIYEKIFINRDHLAKIRSSYFASNAFNAPVLRLPRKNEVETHDINAQKLFASSLHHMVWILLQYKKYSQFKCTLFNNKLIIPINNANCGPETLNKLDIIAFLYCATKTTQQKIDQQMSLIFRDKPIVLPTNITELLCSLPQMKWWDCAYKFSQSELGTEFTDIRATLSRGIEVVRCIDNHGLDPELLYSLGNIFSELAKCTLEVDEKNQLENRAGLYYSSAIPLLEKLKSKISIKLPEKRLFDYTHKELSNKDLITMLEESKLHVAVNYCNENEYEKAIEILSKSKSAKAYYQLGLTYKKMALEGNRISPDTTTETKTKCCALLSKAKHFAYKALDKLKDDNINKNNSIYTDTQELIEDIESNLNKIDTDLSESIANNINGRYSSDENTSPGGTNHMSSRINTHIFHNFSSTPKPALNMNATNYRTAVDSQLQDQTYIDQHCLERIETQIRNLQKRETTITDFMEQTRDWFQENRKLSNQIINSVQSNMQNTTEQFKLLKISVDQVKTQVDECRNDCKDVGDLKKQIAELKKEVNKLKKASSEQAIDERELYNLDDNYRTNDSNTNFAPQLPFQPSQVMPPFNSRLVPPFPVPPNPYQLYGQNLYNLYNQYSQLIQPPSVSGGPPLFDSNRPQMSYSSVYPTPDQMYLDVAHLVPPNVASAATVTPVPPVPSMPTVPVVPAMHVAPAIPNMPSQSLPVITTKSIPTTEVKKTLPVNVVITSSDPLPTCTTAPPPILSVTIPPKHIKGIAHNYQIPMPSTNETKSMPPSLFNFPGSGNESVPTTASPLANWNRLTVFSPANPIVTTSSSKSVINSLNADNKTVVDGVSYGTSLDNSLNKSRTLSEKSNTSIENYDPCPDFKPIIPLPAEVKVTTGEEDEVKIFSARAKLFRFVDKQWKERGLGEMKLLKHKVSGKVRVLMRREQIHKICANHIITPEMEIKPMKNETKAYFWAANDFADETAVVEKFCIRFKTADIAQEFFETFEKARQECVSNKTEHVETPNLAVSSEKTKTMTISGATPTNRKMETLKPATEQSVDPVKTVIGGFTFSNTPTFKTVTENTKVDSFSETTNIKPNIFGNFSFKTNTSSFTNIFNNVKNEVIKADAAKKQESPVKFNTSDMVEEFEPTVEFKPVIPLPALVDQKTGEEDEIILFEHRAKLLRFDSSSKEWKERGLGNIKLLMHKDNNQKVRLLMRREQVMKVCCNHGITKEMSFQKMPNVDKAVTWCAKDFSEGEWVPETFCLRFKTAVVCNDFIEALNTAQSKMKDESKAAKEEQNAAKQTNFGFGDKFKLKVGSWNCPTCYTNNLENYKKCACCEQSKPGDNSGPNNNTCSKNESSSNWGDNFKPKLGTWECKECLIRNEPNVEFCAACDTAKDPSETKTKTKATSNDTFKFNFGIPPKSASTTSTVFGWGDQFKAKEGTWECKQCLIRNESEMEKCSACKIPKNPNSVKNMPTLGNTLETKFKFGIPETANEEKSKSQTTSIFDGTGVHKFRFGVSSNANDNSSNIVSFGDNKPTGVIFATPKANETDCPINFTLKKNDESNKITPAKPALLPTPQSNITNSSLPGTFDFVFKPKTPPKGKSPRKSDKVDESDDNEYVSEDEGHHIHFSPVIPMPDKVEVITGEENEDELYAHRAKLFRFLSGEWKERGIGVVKILKNKDTGKLRVVMRREQVLKICLNHALTSEIIYTPKEEKAWLFTANDYSEGELNLQQFCLRFKSKEIALEFKNAIEKSRGEKIERTKIPNSNSNDNDDVIFVNEIQATLEEKQKAKDLMLPENFFTYQNKKPCQGCRGCEDDNSSELSSSNTTVTTKVPIPTTLSVSTPNKTSSSLFWSSANSLYSTPSYFNKTADNTVFRTPVESNSSNSKENTIMTRNLMNEITSTESCSENSNMSFGQKPLFEKKESTEDEKTPINTKPSILAAPKLGIMTNPESVGKPDVGTKFLFGTGDINLQFSTNKTNVDYRKVNDDKSEVKSIFGSDLNQKGGNLFTSNTPGSMFGPSALSNNATQASFATSNSFENKHETKSDLSSEISITRFGNGTNLPSIWNFSQTTPKNDNSNKDVKIEKISTVKEADVADKKEAVFKIDNNLSFAALSSSGPDFSVQKKSDFQWEGAGQQLFLNVPKVQDKDKINKSNEDTNAREEANTSANVEEEYDPHYEPIVPLPDKIDVVTGEEDEVKVFGERCKLYRYDEQSREWKERGVGEMKILFHPKRNTYRLLLRREQVHKAVLNMLLHMDLELFPLKNSDRAWTWAGLNYAESSGEQETLAVRFKSIDLATAFKDKVLESVRKLQAVAADDIRKAEEASTKMTSGVVPLRLPKHLKDSARIDLSVSTPKAETSEVRRLSSEAETNMVKEGQYVSSSNLDLETNLLRNTYAIQEQLATKQADSETDVFKQVHFQEPEDQEDEDYDNEYDQNEDYEGYYNEEEEESAVYYACDGEAVVRQGDHEMSCPEAHVQVMFDQEVYSPKILVTDNATGEILADMLIHTETEFEMSGDSCSWTGIDYTNNDPVDKTVTVHFHDSEVAMQFYDSCETSKAATYSSTDPET